MSGKYIYNIYSDVNYYDSLEFGCYNCFIKLKINNFLYEFINTSIDQKGGIFINKSLSYYVYFTRN